MFLRKIMMSHKWILFLNLWVFGISCAFGVNGFWQDHAEGWHWYQNRAWIHQGKQSLKNQSQQKLTPVQEMSVVQRVAKEALDQAILNPTPKNVRHYIQVQNKISNQSSQFSKVWQQVLWSHPHLDYSLSHPHNHLGKEIYLAQQRHQTAQSVQQFARHYGLFFFFKSTCPYCHRFAPILKDFAEHYGITVIPISLDGRAIPEFPNARVDNGAASQFHVSVVPAVFAVNPRSRKVIPISYGLITENDLASRIQALSEKLNQNLAINQTPFEQNERAQ